MSLRVGIRSYDPGHGRPARWCDREVQVTRLDGGSGWVASCVIGGIMVSGNWRPNPWEAMGSMLESYLNWLDFEKMGSSTEAARVIWSDEQVQVGEDDEGHYVDFYCGVRWNRVYWAQEEDARNLAQALRRFKEFRLERDR